MAVVAVRFTREEAAERRNDISGAVGFRGAHDFLAHDFLAVALYHNIIPQQTMCKGKSNVKSRCLVCRMMRAMLRVVHRQILAERESRRHPYSG